MSRETWRWRLSTQLIKSVFPYFAIIDFNIRRTVCSAAVRVIHVSEYKVLRIPNKNTVETILVELCAAAADLANSAHIAVSRMALRSKLADAIVDAGKAERAAEVLRTAATCSIKITELEKTTLMPAMRAGLTVQQDR